MTRTGTVCQRRPLAWRLPGPARRHESEPRRAVAALRAEALGYVAMLAFLCAYAMAVAGMAPAVQATLNLLGCGTAGWYLARKGALPSVICNIIWAAITLLGLAWS